METSTYPQKWTWPKLTDRHLGIVSVFFSCCSNKPISMLYPGPCYITHPCLTKEEKSKQNGSCNWAFISACLLLSPCSSTVRLLPSKLDSSSLSLPGAQQHGCGHVSLGTRYPCLPSQPPGTY
ncbi:hypothetical protein LB503_000593 [Fusarium chuoi]|nr:hypothetical protein LB503_000593 [Fusarium chuoi]